MYAIVDIAGQQIKVEKGQTIYVNRLEEKEGAKVNFDKILLIDNDKKINLGEPYIKDASVSAKIIKHLKGNKVLVFKKKRRKGYKTLNGHRQYLSQIEIELISEKGGVKTTTTPKVEPKTIEKPVVKTETKQTITDKKTTVTKPAVKKTTIAKTTTVTKPAVKKTTVAKKTTVTKPAVKKITAKKETKE